MQTSASFLSVFLLVFTSIVASPIEPNFRRPVISRQLTKAPIPSVSELKSHLFTPDQDECMFFTGYTLKSAQDYADAHDKVTLSDMDRDGWADRDENNNHADDCPLSYNFQAPYLLAGVAWTQRDIDLYWDNMSQAFTELCSGTILLALPPSGVVPEDSVFARVEFPTLRAGDQIHRIDSVKLGTGEADGTALSGEEIYWVRCE